MIDFTMWLEICMSLWLDDDWPLYFSVCPWRTIYNLPVDWGEDINTRARGDCGCQLCAWKPLLLNWHVHFLLRQLEAVASKFGITINFSYTVAYNQWPPVTCLSWGVGVGWRRGTIFCWFSEAPLSPTCFLSHATCSALSYSCIFV